MLKKSLLLSAVGITALGLSSAVFADNFGNANQDVYVGVQGGYGTAHWSNEEKLLQVIDPTAKIKDGGFGGGVYTGFDFNQYLAVEGGYIYFPNSKLTSASGNDTAKTYGLDLVGKIHVPVVNGFGLYAKAGPGYLHTSFDADNGKTDNVDLVYGLGADYQINQHLVADISFTRFNGNNKIGDKNYQPNADLYAVGLAYKFNI